jgi:hypothetical protein
MANNVKIGVSRNFTTLTQFAQPTAEQMREVGLLARELIVRRTLRGVDADGAPFAPYSPGYAKQKAQALGSASPVNLQVSGSMLNHLQIVKVEAGKVTLGWVQ